MRRDLKEYKAQWYLKNKERIQQSKKNRTDSQKEADRARSRKYAQENRDKIRLKRKDYFENYRLENKEKIKQSQKRYRDSNKQQISQYNKNYNLSNNYHNLYCKKRKDTDINFKLAILLRKRLNTIIKKEIKAGSAVKDLGCTCEELKHHLESKFQEGMSWDNYGRTGWHIDHIIPLWSFDLTNRKEFVRAVHYTNLQPLWAVDNIRKSNKIIV